MSTPATVAAMQAEVKSRCGRLLQDAGLWDPDPSTGLATVAVRGLRKGVKSIGVLAADALTLADADVAGLSPWAAERVLDEAVLYCLEEVLFNWYRVVQVHMAPVEANPHLGGWLAEEKQSVRNRVSELREACSRPFSDPGGPVEVTCSDIPPFPLRNPWGFPIWPCPEQS
jgi:hypothetical protein